MTGANVADSVFQKLFPAEYYDTFVSKGLRPDGRRLNEARKVVVATGGIRTADASASVKIGQSFALAGVQLELSTPSDEAPDQGSIGVTASVAAVAAVEGRASDANALGLAVTQMLASHIVNEHVVDPSQLCIVKGTHCWHVKLEVYVLNNDGALIDLCIAASTAALASLNVPVMDVQEDTGDLIRRQADGADVLLPLSVQRRPLCLTAGMYKGHLIVDLDADEEDILGSTVSVVIDGQGNILGVHAVSADPVSPKTVATVAKQALQRRGVFNLPPAVPKTRSPRKNL